MIGYYLKTFKQNTIWAKVFALAFLAFVTFKPIYSISQSNTSSFPLSPQATKALVDSLANQINKYYVLKDQALKMSTYIRKRYKEGHYNNIKDPHTLAGALTSDVLFINRDEHFYVEYNPAMANELLGNIDDVPKMVAERLRQDQDKNFGFKKIEILNGNIGYLEISTFARLNKYSQATADAALKVLGNTRALIIDLRYGTGGSVDMVNHIISHFFKEKTHIADIYIRNENVTVPYWTTPDSTYGTLREIPIYILISYKTFSAAEVLSYELQSLKRATIIGEYSRGGAHAVSYRPLSSGFITDMPFGNFTSPVTKKNWERVGVTPDIKVNSDRAQELAEIRIFEDAFEKTKDSTEIKKLKWQLDIIQSMHHPLLLDTVTLLKFSGFYGPFTITFANGSLYYQKTGKAKFALIPMTSSTMRPKGSDAFIIEFYKNIYGKINRIATFYDDGRVEYADRTD